MDVIHHPSERQEDLSDPVLSELSSFSDNLLILSPTSGI
jgi:hypothetical protein